MQLTAADWSTITPALCLFAAGILAVGVHMVRNAKGDRGLMSLISLAGIGAALWLLLSHMGSGAGPTVGFFGGVILDGLSVALSVAICLATALVIVVSTNDSNRRDIDFGEYYGLVLLSAGSMVLLVSSNDFVMLFLNLEIMSLAMYALTGLTRRNPRSNEAAVKYLINGAFATGLLLMGITFVYGATGSLNLQVIGATLAAGGVSPMIPVGIGFLAIGLLFKVGAVPFHMWVPDVYEGAPTTITAFMAVAVKAAAFGALIRVLVVALGSQPEIWAGLIWALAVLSMVVGNLLALHQTSVKRMLAYSGIAHTGYALVGLAALQGTTGQFSVEVVDSVVFYLLVYTFMTLGAFAVLIYMGHEVTHPDGETVEWQDGENLDDLAGLATRRPWTALAMAILMLSLAGMPPTAGFFGKFYLFGAAIAQGHVVLAIIGVLASLVSLYYYVRVVVTMYMRESIHTDERPDIYVGLAVLVAVLLTLYSGVRPGMMLRLSETAVTPASLSALPLGNATRITPVDVASTGL